MGPLLTKERPRVSTFEMTTRVAVLQLNSQERVAENLAVAERLVRQAAVQGAELVVLPEGFAFLGSESAKRDVAETIDGDGPIMASLRAWARKLNLHVIAGGLPEKSDDDARPFNTSLVLNTAGEVVRFYRKLHLFDIDLPAGPRLFESKATTRGQEMVVAELPQLEISKIGLAICYDLRFPELFLAQRRDGAQALTIPAAFTEKTGRAHWEVLLRARAIETQSYVLAAAQWGSHPGQRRTFGNAMIVDPWGMVLAQQSEGIGVVCAEMDLQVLEKTRAQMPLSQHRALQTDVTIGRRR